MRKSFVLLLFLGLAAAALLLAQPANAQKNPILIGYPAILSGGGALFGQPSMVGGAAGGEGYQ